VVLGAVVVLAVTAGAASFILLVAAMALILAWEWARLTGDGRFGALGAVQAAATLLVVAVAVMLGPAPAVLVAALASGALLLQARLAGGAGAPWLSLGPLYIGLPCIALLWLRSVEPGGERLVLWLLVTVWAADSTAYFAGRLIGGPKLAPRLSPRKTWAGLGGAVAGGIAVGIVAAGWVADSPPVVALVVAGTLIALVEQAGDLLESAVKRHFGVKDASGLIPGHGGLFDRVDGLLAAAPALALWCWLDPTRSLSWG